MNISRLHLNFHSRPLTVHVSRNLCAEMSYEQALGPSATLATPHALPGFFPLRDVSCLSSFTQSTKKCVDPKSGHVPLHSHPGLPIPSLLDSSTPHLNPSLLAPL